MQHGNQSHQWKNQLGIHHTNQKIKDDEAKATSDIWLNKMNDTEEPMTKVDSPQEEAASHQAYKLLRRIPGYSIGDPLRQADMILCYSKEATAFAMNKLRPNDCAFILRSDGSFTYSLYEGQAKGDPTAISFQVDDRGSFKLLPLKQFLTRVKVPVLPVALMGNAALVAKYIGEDDDDDESEEDDEVDPTERQGDLSRSASMGQFNRCRLTTGSTQQVSLPVLQEANSNPTATERQGAAKVQASDFSRSASMGQFSRRLTTGSTQQVPSPVLQNPKSNILSDMLAKSAQKHPKAGQTAMNQDNINMMSQMKMGTARPAMNQADSNNIMSRMKMMTATTTGVNPIRMASMQDFRQTMNTLNSVPESSKLTMTAPSQAFTLTRNNPSAPSNAMNRSASTGHFQRPVMPRNVTLQRLDEGGNDAAANSGNASWEVANGNGANRTVNENPLLRVATQLSLTSLPQVPTQPDDDASNETLKSKSQYSIGDQIRHQDMPRVNMEEMKMALMVSKLKVNDTAFVRRSDGSYSYAMVTKKNLVSISFMVTANGDMKTFDLLNAGRYVRIINNEEEMEYVNFVHQVTRAATNTIQQFIEAPENEIDKHAKNYLQQKKNQAGLIGRRSSDPPTSQAAPTFRRRLTTMGEANDVSMPFAISESNMSRGGASTNNMRRRSSDIGAAPSLTRTMSENTFRKASTAKQDAANDEWGVVTDGARTSSPSSMTKTKPSSDKSPIHPPSSPIHTIEQVECKTEDGQTKTVPIYKKGMSIYYKGPNDHKIHAQILSVHFDDLLDPYYTIQFEDGREKQTDNAHIALDLRYL